MADSTQFEFRDIEADVARIYDNDTSDPEFVVQAMAALAKQKLAAFGLKESYGLNIPLHLNDRLPCALNYMTSEGMTFRPFAFGTVEAHTGTKQKQRGQYEIFLACALQAEDTLQVRQRNLTWVRCIERLYARNPTIGVFLLPDGRRQAVAHKAVLGPARWGLNIKYGSEYYQGWIFRLVVEGMQFLRGPR